MKKFDHKTMILTPKAWPRRPVLPLKRWVAHTGKFEDLECAVILEQDGWYSKTGPISLFFTNMLMLGGVSLNEVKKVEYDSVDAILADGWVVD